MIAHIELIFPSLWFTCLYRSVAFKVWMNWFFLSLPYFYFRNRMLNKKNALVVVAIDFGTTYSAFAYSFRDEYKKNHSKIYSNKPWASDHALTQKTPTAILLDKDGKYVCFGYIAEQRYAELLEEEPEATEKHYLFNRFKMVLYQEETSQVKKPRRVSRLN